MFNLSIYAIQFNLSGLADGLAPDLLGIGISLLGGMTIATLVALFIVPVIYVLLETMRELVVDVEEEVRMRESL